MTEIEALDRTRRDYDEVAELYDDLVRRGDEVTDVLSTAMINGFAELVRIGGSAGEVLDAGCGPGQWTDHLDRVGIRANGIDLSPAMVAIARRYRPTCVMKSVLCFRLMRTTGRSPASWLTSR